MTEELTTISKFNEFIKEGIAFVDFYADWCMPCLMMGPVVEEVGKKLKGTVKVGKVNIEENQELAQKYNVMSIPNFVVFKDGKPVQQFVGAMSAEELENKLKKFS